MSAIKIGTCSFSGHKIYPGHGINFVAVDGRIHNFINHKVSSLHFQRKSRRLLAWTSACRRLHKKGLQESSSKKRSRKTIKADRGVAGMSAETVAALKNQTKEERAAKQQQAIKKAKTYQKKIADEKKAAKASTTKKGRK